MPLMVLDRSLFWREKITHCERELRRQQERVAALETENAMLHLKVAQLLDEVMTTRIRAYHEGRHIDQQNLTHINNQVQAIKSEKINLQDIVRSWIETSQQTTANVAQQLQYLCGKWRMVIHQHKVEQDHMVRQYEQERLRRRKLHNSLVEIRGNIRVFCRVRPVLALDVSSGRQASEQSSAGPESVILNAIDNENVVVSSAKHQKSFEFDRAYKPAESQSTVFEEVKPLLTSLLDGYNVCIMAYGQTGSGKTYTMLGPPTINHKGSQRSGNLATQVTCNRPPDGYLSRPESPQDTSVMEEAPQEVAGVDGLIPRAVTEVFRLMQEKKSTQQVQVSVGEIYNNELRDLLNLEHSNTQSLSERLVSSVKEVLDLVSRGLLTRTQASTGVHLHSSRSHLIVTLSLLQPPLEADTSKLLEEGELLVHPSPLPDLSTGAARTAAWTEAAGAGGAVCERRVESKLQLVDLAGSESVAMSGTSGLSFRETSHINRSLSALADTLVAVDEGRDHVPYRNSRLTHYLQDAIGGDSKLLIMLCTSPTRRYETETLHCLAFGQRIRQVQRCSSSPRQRQGARRTKSASQIGLKGAQLSPGRRVSRSLSKSLSYSQ